MSIRVPTRVFAVAAATLFIGLPVSAQEKVDTATIARIKMMAMDSSQVMTIASWMSDVYGPNLTWSPNAMRSGEWAMATMKSYGLANVHAEPWYVPNALGWANETVLVPGDLPESVHHRGGAARLVRERQDGGHWQEQGQSGGQRASPGDRPGDSGPG